MMSVAEEFRRSDDRHDQIVGKHRSALTSCAMALAIVAALGWGGYIHYRRSADAAATLAQTESFVPTVRVARARRAGSTVKIELPGATEPFDLAYIDARDTGYIAKRFVDIGSIVKKGDLLAVISSPELDRQLAEAKAQLAHADAALVQADAMVEQDKANVDLARVTNARFEKLAIDGWATWQESDNWRLGLAAKEADLRNAGAGVEVARANINAQQAAVRRLDQLTSYENVIAPFDGIVTTRNVDVGDLVSADEASGGQHRMFTIAHIAVLRVRIDIPQSDAVGVTDGIKARVTVPEMPGRVFTGKLARSSIALATDSRTLRAEVDVDNPDLILRPGMYVTVKLRVPRTTPAVTIPAAALIFNADGTQVAAVKDAVVELRKVHILRDLGTTLEINSGLKGDETVILNPYADLVNGQRVKIQTDPAT
jgi:HlyD family secretion protein